MDQGTLRRVKLSAIWNPRWDLGIEKGPLMEKMGEL